MIDRKEKRNLFGELIHTGAKIDREALARLLSHVLSGLTLEEFISYLTNRYEAAMHYVELTQGKKHRGHKISLLFNPHRLTVRSRSNAPSIGESLSDPKYISGLARATIFSYGSTNLNDMLYHCLELGVNGRQLMNEFPPYRARDLCLQFGCSATSRVLDPCAGWGGRMLGVSVVSNNYHCCEPSTPTYNGLLKLRDFICAFQPAFKASVNHTPFEDHKVKPGTFDFALTSPPYYDTERYSDEATNSFNRYPSYREWCDGFFAQLVHNTMRALKPGCAFVLSIGTRTYPMDEDLAAICKGKYELRLLNYRLGGIGAGLKGKDKKTKGEVFYEVRK